MSTPDDRPPTSDDGARLRRAVAAVCVVLLVTTLVSLPVAAAAEQDSPHPFSIQHDESDDGGVLSGIADAVPNLGWTARIGYWASSVGLGDSPDGAETLIQQDASYVNNHSAEFAALAEQCAPADRDLRNYDVVKVVYERQGESAVRYVEANATNDSVESLAVVNSTDRTIDYTVTLTDHAPGLVHEDLEHIYDEYADPDECPDGRLMGRLQARYSGGYEWTEGEA